MLDRSAENMKVPVQADDSKIGTLKQKLATLKSERSFWETHWQEITDYMLTRKDTITRSGSPGEKKGVQLVDNTATQANEKLAGALHGMLTNQTSNFFGLTTGDDELDNNDDVRLWLQEVVEKMHRRLNNSNFHTEVHEFYLDIGSIGTATLFIEEDKKDVVRFSTKFIKEIYVCEDAYGNIYELYRTFDFTAQQCIQYFGEKAVPEKVKDAYQNNPQQKFEICQAIYPDNDDSTNGRYKFLSTYFLVQEGNELADPSANKSGFSEKPYVCARWSKASGETYGRSPGMVALPEAKMINEMMKTTIRGAQKTIDPPLQAPDDGFILKPKTSPGSISYYRAGSNDRIEPIFNNANINFGLDMLNQIRTAIRSAFYVDQLELPQTDRATATETMQRTQDRNQLLGPFMGRMNSEFLTPTINRVFSIMMRRGEFSKPPLILSKRKLDVKFTSTIAQAQLVNDMQSVFKYFQGLSVVGQFDPDVYDNVDGDAVSKIFAKGYGLPQQAIRKQADIKNIRAAKAKAQQDAMKAQQQQGQVDNASKMLPALAKQQQANTPQQ